PGVNFMLRVGSHQGRAAAHPFIVKLSANAQGPAQCHDKLNAMVRMTGRNVPGSPYDHGGRPKKGPGTPSHQTEPFIPRSIFTIASHRSHFIQDEPVVWSYLLLLRYSCRLRTTSEERNAMVPFIVLIALFVLLRTLGHFHILVADDWWTSLRL